jgi:iron complex outermembrane receptor protein
MIRIPIRIRHVLPALACVVLPALVSAQGDKKPRSDSSQTLPGVSVEATKPVPSAGELTAADIGRFDGVSLIGPINTIPGVFMQTRTPFGGARITLRGYYPSVGNSANFNGLGYQVFLNGIPITDATGSSVLDDIDYSTLGKVEVIKGPNSSRFGSFIGGTVNLGTAMPTANASEFSQQVLSGSNSMLRTNTTFSHSSDGSSFVLNYGHQGTDGFRQNDFSGKEYLRASGDFRASSRQTISMYFSYNRSNEGLAGEIDTADFYARRPVSDANYLANNSHIQITSYFAGVGDRFQINDHLSSQMSVFGSGRISDQPFAHGFTDVNQVNFGARGALDWSGQWDAVAVTAAIGATVQQSNNTSNGVFILPFPPFVELPSATQNFAVNSSVFTEWSFTFPGAWVATVGGSLNNNVFATHNMLKSNVLFDTTTIRKQTFDAQFTPRVALTKTWDNYTAYASVSTGYAPPLLSQIIANNGTVDLTLKPEHATQYEAGIMGSWFDRHLTGQLTWFNLDDTDKLVSQTANAVTFTTNAGEQRNQGYELSLGWLAVDDKDAFLTMLHPWATYTYTDAKFVSFKSDNNATAATVDFSGNAVPRVPKTMYSVGLDANLRGGWYVNSTYLFVDQVPITLDNLAWMKSYALLNAKLGYRAAINEHYTLDASVGGSNLTGSTYYNSIFVGPNIKSLAQGPDGGNGDGYVLPAPYSAQYFVNVKLSYKW